MVKKDASVERTVDVICIEIDGKAYQVPNGYTLSTAISYAIGINYRKTNRGKEKGPICNMGICYECSVFLEGVGYTRACMIQARDGMCVKTAREVKDVHQEKKAENPQPNTENLEVFDLAIVGAGPGGLGAADELLNEDIRVVVIDEQQKAGGQIYRQSFESKNSRIPVHPLVKKVLKNPVLSTMFGSAIWAILSVNQDGEIASSSEEHHTYRIYFENNKTVEAKYLLISTGAYDRLVPFKGWDRPGVMSAGGLQIAVKTQGFLPGKSTFLLGSHPFLLIVAQNIIKSGGTVQGIAFSIKFPQLNELLGYGVAGLRKWHKSMELISALKLIQKEKIPLYFNTLPIEASGNSGVESLTIGKVEENGKIHSATTVACDTIGVCYGFNASSELARQMQCESYYDEVNGGWLIKTSEQMETNQQDVYAAGEITGVGGAELAEIEGRIAALSILSKMQSPNFNESTLQKLLKERASWSKFAHMLSSATFVGTNYITSIKNAPETVICKCEEVTLENINEAMASNPHLSSLNSIKLMTRCGMGLCQGRYCERPLLDIVEKALDKKIPKESFSSRYPVKPIAIGNFNVHEN